MLPKQDMDRHVIKASPAIQIQSNITLLQRRGWNVLLYNAYSELPTAETHTIAIKDLMNILEFDSKNDEYLKEALEALVGCTVKWNLLKKDQTYHWGVTTLLAHAEIENGVCAYSYSVPLREKLHNPRMYARISLSLQNKFKGKHAQALWELCTDYLHETEGYGETRWITLDEFRELMGIADDEYPSFKRLNQKVIKPAVKEINDVWNYHVEVEYQRKSRRVVAVKFRIQKLKQVPKQATQRSLFPDADDMQGVLMELVQAGVSRHEALKIYNRGFSAVNASVRPDGGDWDAYLQEKIDLMKAQPAGKVGNKAGFLRRAIEENWTDDKINTRKEAKRRKEIQEKVARLEEQRQAAQEEWADKSGTVTEQIIRENPDIIQNIATDLLQQQESGINLYYKHTESPEENYKRVPVAVLVNMEIKKRHDDRYTELEKTYGGKIKSIEAEINTLKASLRG